jgi:intracellular multiplication protein IcmT
MSRRPNSDAHWRDTARNVKFFIWDGQVVFPLVLFIFYMRLSTLIFVFVSIFVFTILNRFGFSPLVFLRVLRGWASGPRKIAIPWWEKNNFE